MRSILRTAVIVAASLLLVPQFVAAADLGSEIQDMKQRLQAMESQLQVQTADLTDARAMVAAQQTQLDSVALVDDDRDVTSALSSFLESTDISGFAAAGWNYTDDGGTPSVNSNTFQLDQAWISMSKGSTAASRAGFNLELAAGSRADYDGNGDLGIHAASVSYLADLGSGVMVNAGILNTALGAEVAAQNGNWQITRGAVWGMQPVTSTGVTLGYAVNDNISVMFGMLNDPVANVRGGDNDNKGITSQVSYSQGNFGVSAGYNRGQSGANHRVALLDVVATLDVNDNLSAWVNYDYATQELTENAAGTSSQNGIAFAARLAVMDDTGISGRFELVSGEDATGAETVDLTTYTVTVDHALSAGLTAKFEYRYNNDGMAGQLDDSEVALQLLYEF